MFSTGLGTTEIDNSWSINCPAASNSQQKGGIFPWEHVLLLAGDPGSAFSQLLFWSPSGEDRTWGRSATWQFLCSEPDPEPFFQLENGCTRRSGIPWQDSDPLTEKVTGWGPSSASVALAQSHRHLKNTTSNGACVLYSLANGVFQGVWGRNVRGAVPPATRFNSAGSLRKCSVLRHGLVSELSLLRGQEC